MPRIGGKAKAMIVTRSRLHAVRYKLAVDAYLKKKGYAFQAPGRVLGHGKGRRHGLHRGRHERLSRHRRPPRPSSGTNTSCSIVANKFQTGFDQPLLHTMYVDKKLGGVNAVQTLSRLNRTHPGKEDTAVLDFANEQKEIQDAFQPYYDRTILSEGTDPNLLHDLQDELAGSTSTAPTTSSGSPAIHFDPKSTQDKLFAALAPVVDRYEAAEDEEQRKDFRKALNDYVRLYAFLSQIITFTDADLEKLYVFGRLLLRKLPVKRDELPVEIQKTSTWTPTGSSRPPRANWAWRRGRARWSRRRAAGNGPEPPTPSRHCRRSSRT